MSRLFVKNLPKKVSNEEIQQLFESIGPLTDVNLKFREGKFRRFCFIGYEKTEDAAKAIDHFHNSYFKQCKISVEASKDVDKDSALPLKNKKEESLNLQSKDAPIETSMQQKNFETLCEDPDFQDYLNANKKDVSDYLKETISSPRKNEDESCNDFQDDEEEKEEKLAKMKTISDLEYLNSLKNKTNSLKEKPKKFLVLYTIKIRPLNKVIGKLKTSKPFTKKAIQEFLKPLKFQSLRIPPKNPFIAYVGFKSEKDMNQALKKDKSFINGIRVHLHEYTKANTDEISAPGSGNAPWSISEEKLKNSANPVGETGKLFVRNLWYQATEEALRELFGPIGPIADITVPICKLTRKCKGFAHVSFVFPEHAVKAMNNLDGTCFKGRILHILPSRVNDESEETEGKTSFKDKKLKELKASASSWHNWNSLFISSSAVIEVMSKKYEVTKQEILDNEKAQSAAVNLALGESEIVNGTKRFLIDEGVSLSAFENPSTQRSNTIMLAKNLPAETSAQELQEIFGKYGELDKVVMPPYGVTGIISFLDPSEAKSAFRKLAYSRFKYSPLYLEWAPINTLSTGSSGKSASKEKEKTNDKEKQDLNSEELDSGKEKNLNPEEETSTDNLHKPKDLIPQANTTVYVKNLNFSTTEEGLREHFSKCGEVYSVLIAKKRTLSQGYGFVQYYKKADVNEALRTLQDSNLDGHNIAIKCSEKTLNDSHSRRILHNKGEQNESQKILVKNIPFQATSKEITQLFKAFGGIKSIRLPEKFGKKEHRGFGFVEFVTILHAKQAFESLSSSTHLYGRRLVLEWAKADESVGELRARTAEHFMNTGPKRKKLKLDEMNE